MEITSLLQAVHMAQVVIVVTRFLVIKNTGCFSNTNLEKNYFFLGNDNWNRLRVE